MLVGQQDDRERTSGNRFRHPPQAEGNEQKAATADQGGEVHLDGGHLGRDRGRYPRQGRQENHREGLHEQMEAKRKDQITIKRYDYEYMGKDSKVWRQCLERCR